MTEPTVTGSAWAFGALTITGTILGMHYDAMLIGFIAAMVSLLHVKSSDDQERTRWRVFCFVVSAGFLAGVFAPIVALMARTNFEWVASMSEDALRGVCAAIVGGVGHLIIPIAISELARFTRVSK